MASFEWREKEFLSRKDIAEILSISNDSAFKIIHQMPFVRIGNTYRVSCKAFQQWIKDQERKSKR